MTHDRVRKFVNAVKQVLSEDPACGMQRAGKTGPEIGFGPGVAIGPLRHCPRAQATEMEYSRHGKFFWRKDLCYAIFVIDGLCAILIN